MSQRREPRLTADETVDVTVFGEPDIRLPGRIRAVSGRGIGLQLEGPLATGSALKVTLPNAILLGEVIYCRPEGSGWYVGVELEHSLCGLAGLASALRAFSEEYLGSEHPYPAQYANRQDEQ